MKTYLKWFWLPGADTMMDSLWCQISSSNQRWRRCWQCCGGTKWLPLGFLWSPGTEQTQIGSSGSTLTSFGILCWNAGGYRGELDVDGVVEGQLPLELRQLPLVSTLPCLHHVFHVEHPWLPAVHHDHPSQVRQPEKPKESLHQVVWVTVAQEVEGVVHWRKDW